MSNYQEFLASKAPRANASGFDPSPMPDHLFDFQAACVAFAVKQGRAGIYLDTGLGKTRVQLEWATQCAAQSNGKALILTPLAVARQIEREAKALGYDARVVRDQSDVKDGINICNYDRLEKLDPDSFGVVSLDEAGILKSFGGKTSQGLIDAFDSHRFRMCATATPAPNDHMELGQQSSFLGIMPANEMMMRWFLNDTSTASQQWRLKKHAEQDFWDWMASWSRMAQSPEDMGFDGTKYILPPLNIVRHKAYGTTIKPMEGSLFTMDVSATNMFDIKRQTIAARAKLTAEIVFASFGESEWKLNKSVGQEERMPSTLNGGQITKTQIPNTGLPSSGNGIEGTKSHFERQIKTCATNSVSNGKIMPPCSTSKTEHVPFAGQELPEATGDSTSITATKQEKFEDYSVISATLLSAHSETMPTISGKPFVTSKGLMLPSWVLWCDTNDEQKMLERELGDSAFSIYGDQPIEKKEGLHDAWLRGDRPVLITKPSIFGHGCNWQHCHNMAYVGRTFSYESWYQSVRRCWRFGQTKPVNVHIIVAEGEDQIGRVIDRKADDHARMKQAMAIAMKRDVGRDEAKKIAYNPTHKGELPSWL